MMMNMPTHKKEKEGHKSKKSSNPCTLCKESPGKSKKCHHRGKEGDSAQECSEGNRSGIDNNVVKNKEKEAQSVRVGTSGGSVSSKGQQIPQNQDQQSSIHDTINKFEQGTQQHLQQQQHRGGNHQSVEKSRNEQDPIKFQQSPILHQNDSPQQGSGFGDQHKGKEPKFDHSKEMHGSLQGQQDEHTRQLGGQFGKGGSSSPRQETQLGQQEGGQLKNQQGMKQQQFKSQHDDRSGEPHDSEQCLNFYEFDTACGPRFFCCSQIDGVLGQEIRKEDGHLCSTFARDMEKDEVVWYLHGDGGESGRCTTAYRFVGKAIHKDKSQMVQEACWNGASSSGICEFKLH